MTYKPLPIDTSLTILPDDIEEVIEVIAENVHERWADNRIREGWTYGVERNDLLKKHPCLKPYHELEESEKQYDRITATETIKVLINMGFKFER
ncbi:RyR domain-containing protein [Bacillus solimangrovi]|nr:RyR domain-containing protein [Bacillus solimangrovi]